MGKRNYHWWNKIVMLQSEATHPVLLHRSGLLSSYGSGNGRPDPVMPILSKDKVVVTLVLGSIHYCTDGRQRIRYPIRVGWLSRGTGSHIKSVVKLSLRDTVTFRLRRLPRKYTRYIDMLIKSSSYLSARLCVSSPAWSTASHSPRPHNVQLMRKQPVLHTTMARFRFPEKLIWRMSVAMQLIVLVQGLLDTILMQCEPRGNVYNVQTGFSLFPTSYRY